MKKLIGIVGIIVLFSCKTDANAEPPKDFVFIERGDSYTYISLDIAHDNKRKVTCWQSTSIHGTSISCIPDWQLEQPKTP